MLRGPFGCLGAFLIGVTLTVVFLPLAFLVGYPALAALGLWYLARGVLGRLERPGEVASIWTAYLGLILILHGIVLGFDTPLAGAPPTPEEKRFGARRRLGRGAGQGPPGADASAPLLILRNPCRTLDSFGVEHRGTRGRR
ncbi:hypothetical protein [Paludisphaera soli]|uniref:hypothetical protein n=1 Tax=Paludisphaera soli TaxID=2712865 RepID=UPI0013ED7FFF|nr:hypothetical protein [Paludisphaera soli]